MGAGAGITTAGSNGGSGRSVGAGGSVDSGGGSGGGGQTFTNNNSHNFSKKGMPLLFS